MPKLDIPFQLSPVLKPKIWGRASLEPLFPCPLATKPVTTSVDPENQVGAKPLIGEVWITDDTSRFMNGPLAGLTLKEASQEYGPELNGARWKDSRFPVLAKYIYTSDWLSVQVHPDDDYARVHDSGQRGKCEMWYVVRVDRGARILLGAKRGVTKERLQAAFEKGASKELLNGFRPRAGEAIFVPPGTVHALGPGLVLFEVEENSDLTYRLDDFGRVGLDGKPRPMHWEKGLEVIRTDLPARRNLPRLEFREPYGWRRYVLACGFFALEELILKRMGTFRGTPQRVEVLSVAEGEGRVETAAGWLGYRTGDTWLIPPATAKYRLVPALKTRLLKFYVPHLDKDFRRPLRKRGVSAARVNKVVFE